MKEEIPIFYFYEDENAYYWNVPDKTTGGRSIIVAMKKDIKKDLKINEAYAVPVKEYKILI